MRKLKDGMVGVFLLAGAAFGAGEPPWPTPPPDDDDPLFVRHADTEIMVKLIADLQKRDEFTGLLREGASIVKVTSRAAISPAGESQLIIDLLFRTGAATKPGYERFKVIRCRCPRDPRAVFAATIDISPDLIMTACRPPVPDTCFASTSDAFEACRVVLADRNVKELASSLMPYYSLQAIRTPVGADHASGRTITVTLEFVDQQDRDDRYTLVVDVAKGDGGASVKSLRSR